MAYTLAEFARVEKDPLRQGVIDVFRRESFIMDSLSWESIGTLGIEVLRTKSLPTVDWRKIGGDYSESKGEIEKVAERVFDLGGYIDVDKLLVKAQTILDQRAQQAEMFVTSLAYKFNDSFINADPTVDEDQFSGLWWRLVNTTGLAGQTVLGGGVDISPDASGLSTEFNEYFDALMNLIHKCDGHKCDILAMNEDCYTRTMSGLRQLGLFATTQDNYGRTVTTFGPGGPKIIDLGVKADQSTKIIGNLESDDGSSQTSGDATSIYALKLGENYLRGIQLYDVDTNDLGLLENGRAYRTVISWPIGIMFVNPRSIARLVGVVAA